MKAIKGGSQTGEGIVIFLGEQQRVFYFFLTLNLNLYQIKAEMVILT